PFAGRDRAPRYPPSPGLTAAGLLDRSARSATNVMMLRPLLPMLRVAYRHGEPHQTLVGRGICGRPASKGASAGGVWIWTVGQPHDAGCAAAPFGVNAEYAASQDGGQLGAWCVVIELSQAVVRTHDRSLCAIAIF